MGRHSSSHCNPWATVLTAPMSAFSPSCPPRTLQAVPVAWMPYPYPRPTLQIALMCRPLWEALSNPWPRHVCSPFRPPLTFPAPHTSARFLVNASPCTGGSAHAASSAPAPTPLTQSQWVNGSEVTGTLLWVQALSLS